jgi:hypothetical protein
MLENEGLITEVMGVGSICRRNSEREILNIAREIKERIPQVKLHGFGVKTSLLKYPYGKQTVSLFDSIDTASLYYHISCPKTWQKQALCRKAEIKLSRLAKTWENQRILEVFN